MRVLFLLLAACGPSLPVSLPPPNPTGPCVQLTGTGRRRFATWKNGERVADLDAALADNPDTRRRMKRSNALMWSGVALAPGALVVGTGAGLIADSHGDEPKQSIGIALVPIGMVSFAVALLLEELSDRARAKALADYNAAAAIHGCPPG